MHNTTLFLHRHTLPTVLMLILLLLWPQSSPISAQTRPLTPAQPPSSPHVDASHKTLALLLNGGAGRQANFLSHFEHIQEMMEVLIRRGIRREAIVVFNADGEDSDADMATRQTTAWPEGYWLLDRTQEGRLLRPRITYENSTLASVELRPAKKATLRRWFMREGKTLHAGDTLVLYVTDHGQRGKRDLDNGTISLWGETLSVSELRDMLGLLAPGVRVVMMMSQCFSGTFAAAMYPNARASLPSGNTCGYFSTTNDRFAYGCYPEGRAQQRLGHAFTWVDALYARSDLPSIQDQVALLDGTPDVPLSTSDVYMERLLMNEAKARRVALDRFIDPLLEDAFQRNLEPWRGDLEVIDQLAEAYGMTPPRRLAALEREIEALAQQARQLQELTHQWNDALGQAQQHNMQDFLQSAPSGRTWSRLLAPRRLKRMRDRDRQVSLNQLATELEQFTQERPDVLGRLRQLAHNAEQADAIQYRMEVRMAVALRLRNRLLRIATGIWEANRPVGSTTTPQEMAALQRLRTCEATPLGTAPGTYRPRTVVEMPSMQQEKATRAALEPSRLGIRYTRPSPQDRKRYTLNDGAVVVTDVATRSPAQRAGLAPGDIITGGGSERTFTHTHSLSHWVMTTAPDTAQNLFIRRNGQPKTLTVAFTRGSNPIAQTKAKPIQAGERAPSLAVLRFKETPLNLTGTPHLLFFWTPDCAAVCRHALREVMSWSLRSGIEVVALGHADDSALRAFFDTMPSPLPLRRVADPNALSFQAYGLSQGPAFVLVDGQGTVQHLQPGWQRGDPLHFNRWRTE
ncbi:MAG: PDZ domain-containing protein [Myxococcota bacterium]